MRELLRAGSVVSFVVLASCSKRGTPSPTQQRAAEVVAASLPRSEASAGPATAEANADASAGLERRDREHRAHQYLRIQTDEPALAPNTLRTEKLLVPEFAALRSQALDRRYDHWRFAGFDADSLDFVFLHTPKFEGKLVRPVVERRVRVARSAEAERALEVTPILDFYEVGENGIRGGMQVDPVIEHLGEPLEERPLGAFGNCDFVYADRTVRFLGNAVASVSGPDAPGAPQQPTGHCAGRLQR